MTAQPDKSSSEQWMELFESLKMRAKLENLEGTFSASRIIEIFVSELSQATEKDLITVKLLGLF